MRLVFWQPDMSIHQLPYIQKLMDDQRVEEVVVVAVDSVFKGREKMGWNADICNEDGRCHYYVHPDDTIINELMRKDESSSIHLFSGVTPYPYVFHAFKISLHYKVRRGVITERPYTYAFGYSYGKPLWMHRLRYWLREKRYIPYIDFIFGFGQESADYYRTWSNSWKVFTFAYCTREPIYAQDDQSEFSGVPRFLFVASLTKRKDPVSIVKVVQQSSIDGVFDFVGDGEMKRTMEAMIGHDSRFKLLGVVDNKDIHRMYNQHDVLILPSYHDGWGAVVNEALQSGLYVIVSDRCGSKELVEGSDMGRVFIKKEKDSLNAAIKYVCSNIGEIRRKRHERREWAKNHISGHVISKYMVDCLSGVEVNIPWREP